MLNSHPMLSPFQGITYPFERELREAQMVVGGGLGGKYLVI